MTPITTELLDEFFCDGNFTQEGLGWKVVTEHGRVIYLNNKVLDLAQCLTPLVPGETEEDREETLFGACYFCYVAYGCVDVRHLGFLQRSRLAAYAKGYGFAVDENNFREFGTADAMIAFGDTAKLRNNWFPCGWRITVPDIGYIVFGLSGKDLTVLRIEGNLYTETLRFLKNWQGHAVVRGKTAFCSTWVVHGEMLGIRVIPAIPVGLWGWYVRSHFAFLPAAGLCFIVAAQFPNLSLWWVGVGGWIVAAILMNFLMGDDRKRGQALLNQFPGVQARHAEIDEARERGMLQ